MADNRPKGHALGLGGVFFRSRDPKALAAWYAEWLGLEDNDGLALFFPAAMPPGSYTVWSPFQQQTDYFGPGEQQFMINLIVDDVDAALARVAKGGATVVPKRENSEYGRFGWFLDPDGHRVELWQPPHPNEQPPEETSHE